MRWIVAASLCLLVVLRTGVCLAQAPDNAVLGQAHALVRAGKAEDAWQLLAPLERQYAGQPDFDYLLGVAALESGRPNRATFILERIITVNPGHLAARLEMARACFSLRDFERAEREFVFILKSAPPAEIAALSQAYLARMRQAKEPERADLRGYAEVTLGRDTNVSAAASQSSVFIPGLGADFVPDPMSQRRPDDFRALGAGFEYRHALRADLGVVAAADVRQRWHSDMDRFDTRVGEFEAVLIHRVDERDAMRYSVRHNHFELDNRRYRVTQSLGAEWSRSLSPRTRIAASGQGHRIRYWTDEARGSSSDLVALSLSAIRVLQPSTLTTVAGAVYFGSDNAVAGRADGDRHILGLSLGLQRLLLPRVEGYVRFSALDSRYATQNPDFGVTRRDRQFDAVLGIGWDLTNGWLLRPQVARTFNHSNLPLNEYGRTETSITLRRVWD